jgi:hypothetical protein
MRSKKLIEQNLISLHKQAEKLDDSNSWKYDYDNYHDERTEIDTAITTLEWVLEQ